MCEAYSFRAGAGSAVIRLTQDMFPNVEENYTGIHDLPSVQVLILQDTQTYALVCADIVILMDRQEVIDFLTGQLGIERDHIILHTTHVLSMPHFSRHDGPEEIIRKSRGTLTAREAAVYADRENRMYAALLDAMQEACAQAKSDLRPACYGSGTCEAMINVNRVTQLGDTWIQGTNQDGFSDHTVTVLKFEDTDGAPIALLYHCNTAPGSLEGSVTKDGRRLVSGDLASASEKYLAALSGSRAPAFYLTGCTGDQWQALRARIDYIDAEGTQVISDLGEEGFLVPDILGLRLAQQVVQAAGQIVCSVPQEPIRLLHRTFSYPGSSDKPADSPVDLLLIGEDAWAAVGVELTAGFGCAVKEASPFAHTLLIEFATDGGRYMAEREYYDHGSYQAGKSRFAAGAAEAFRTDLIRMLCEAAER